MVSPVQESMRVALSLSDNQMGVLQGPALTFPLVLAAIPLGLFIDRHSRVRLLLLFALLLLIGSVLTVLAPSYSVLLAARCLVGLAALGVNPIVFSLVADLYEPSQRGRAMMTTAIGQFGGMAAAFAIGGMLLSYSGQAPDAWRYVLLWMTAPLVLIPVALLRISEPVRTGVSRQSHSMRGAFAELWQYRPVIMPILVGVVMIEIAVGGALVWTAPTLSRDFGLSSDSIGIIMAMGLVLSGLLGPALGGVLADICQRSGGPRRTVAALIALAALCTGAALFSIVPNVIGASVLFVAFMTLVGALVVMAMSLFSVVIPNELRGLCISLLTGAVVLCGGLAPLVVSLMSGVLGGTAMIGVALAIVGVLGGICGVTAFALGRRYFPSQAAP